MADGSEESINTKKTLMHALSEYNLAIKHTGELLNWKPTICKPWLNARERFNHCPVNTMSGLIHVEFVRVLLVAIHRLCLYM